MTMKRSLVILTAIPAILLYVINSWNTSLPYKLPDDPLISSIFILVPAYSWLLTLTGSIASLAIGLAIGPVRVSD